MGDEINIRVGIEVFMKEWKDSFEGKKLLDHFYYSDDYLLLEKRKQIGKMDLNLENYAFVSGLTNPKILERFLHEEHSLALVAALAIIPIIVTAWADNIIDEKERLAILEHGPDFGIKKSSIVFELIERWLGHQPNDRLLAAWTKVVNELCSDLHEQEREELKHELLKHVYHIVNMTSGVATKESIGHFSEKEKRVIKSLEEAFYLQ